MKFFKYLFSSLLFLAGMFGFQSCDEVTYDVTGNPDNLIFLKTNSNFNISHFPTGGVETVRGDEIQVKIPVYATRPVDTEVLVSAEIDESLVAQYNAMNSVEYSGVDEDLVVWRKKTVKFLPSSYVALDSIEFSIPKENCAKLLEGSYVIPIRLTDSSSATISLNNRYSYTVINCDYIYIDSEATEMVGTVLTDKSYWEISSDDASADLSNCIDGENSTSTSFSKSPTITIDLKSVMKVQGASVYTTGDIWGRISRFSWSVSADGKKWIDLCNLSYPPTIDDAYSLVLLGTVEARYIKFNMEWYVSWAGRKLGEINVYVTE